MFFNSNPPWPRSAHCIPGPVCILFYLFICFVCLVSTSERIHTILVSFIDHFNFKYKLIHTYKIINIHKLLILTQVITHSVPVVGAHLPNGPAVRVCGTGRAGRVSGRAGVCAGAAPRTITPRPKSPVRLPPGEASGEASGLALPWSPSCCDLAGLSSVHVWGELWCPMGGGPLCDLTDPSLLP